MTQSLHDRPWVRPLIDKEGRASNAFNNYDFNYYDYDSARRYATEPDGDADGQLLPKCPSLLV